MRKGSLIEEIEKLIRDAIIKMTLIVFTIICVLIRDIHCGVIFIIMSFMGYIRFYCISDLMIVVLNRIKGVLTQSIVNYIVTCFVTGIFLIIVILNYGKVCLSCAIIGTINATIVIMVYGISKIFKRK